MEAIKIIFALLGLVMLIAGLVALWKRTPDPEDQDDF